MPTLPVIESSARWGVMFHSGKVGYF